jgi:hypothetical protein
MHHHRPSVRVSVCGEGEWESGGENKRFKEGDQDLFCFDYMCFYKGCCELVQGSDVKIEGVWLPRSCV